MLIETKVTVTSDNGVVINSLNKEHYFLVSSINKIANMSVLESPESLVGGGVIGHANNAKHVKEIIKNGNMSCMSATEIVNALINSCESDMYSVAEEIMISIAKNAGTAMLTDLICSIFKSVEDIDYDDIVDDIREIRRAKTLKCNTRVVDPTPLK